MLSQDLVLAIAFDSLRAGVPARYPAVRIEHIDRVVANALNKHLQLQGAVEGSLFEPPLFRYVARDLCEADQRSFVVMDSVHHHMGEKFPAVLAQAPTFHFETLLLGRNPQDAIRQAVGAVLGKEEAGEMIADDFLSRIAFETLRPGIPANDPALGIQHIQRVVGDRIDEQLERFSRRLCFANR